MREVYVRSEGRRVLRALYQNGPMAISTLAAVLSPAASVRGLQKITRRLEALGLIRKRHGTMTGAVAQYYQLATSPLARRVLAPEMGVSEGDILQLPVRNQELEHWQSCTLWTHRLTTMLPEARIIRDFRVVRDERALNALLASADDLEVIPDLLICAPAMSGKDIVYIAVEIERTSKSSKRVYAKLKKYAQQTRLDGVLYVSSRDQIMKTVDEIFRGRVLERAHRVRHYASMFLMFAEERALSASEIRLHRSEGKYISFCDWIHFLTANELSSRREISAS